MNKVWVNGTFDVLHIGHIKLLEYASSFGYVMVGIDSDDRVKSLKGVNRPFNNQQNRKKLLESLKFVDKVKIFETENELKNIIKDYSPNYFIIGCDYKNKTVIGSEYVEKIIFFDKIKGISTSDILSYEKRTNNL